MLERVWRKGNPLALLVGVQTSTATMENSVEFLVNEVLLDYSYANLLMDCLWLLLNYSGRIE